MAIEIKFIGETVRDVIVQAQMFIDMATRQEEHPEPAKRGRPPKAPPDIVEEKSVEAAPVEPVEDEEDEQVEQSPNALANEKLKQEVIESLQSLFVAGKVKVLRHVLDKYGDGAKSFPEIEASRFHVIKEALDRGEAA